MVCLVDAIAGGSVSQRGSEGGFVVGTVLPFLKPVACS